MALNNDQVQLAKSAAVTGTNVHRGQNHEHRGGVFYVDVTGTDGDGTQDLQVTIRARDRESDKTVDLIVDTFSNGATGTRAYLIYPGVSDNQASFDGLEEVPLPVGFEVETQVQQGGASAEYTYSIGVDLLK